MLFCGDTKRVQTEVGGIDLFDSPLDKRVKPTSWA